jgi:D-alanine-D-alanine ligase
MDSHHTQNEIPPLNVAVVYNEPKPDSARDEIDVLTQVESVSQALEQRGYAVSTIGATLDLSALTDRLRQVSPPLVFNLVEALNGEEELIAVVPLLLDTLAIPYTGSQSSSLFSTTDKILAKQILAANAIPTPAWSRCRDYADGTSGPNPPMIFKSAFRHGSVGIEEDSIAASESQASDRVARMNQREKNELFAESFVDGREFNISLLAGGNGPEVLPCAEIRFEDWRKGKPRLVGYRAKWDTASWEYTHTTRTFEFSHDDGPLLAEVRRLSLACWDAFGISGYGRVDFRVDENGKPWVLEINANPCLSPDGGFVAAAIQAGITYGEMVLRIMQAALER